MQKRLDTTDEASEMKELVYDTELLQSLLTVAGVRMRRVHSCVESILQQMSSQAHKDVDHRLFECTASPRHDGTISVHLNWSVFLCQLQVAFIVYAFQPPVSSSVTCLLST